MAINMHSNSQDSGLGGCIVEMKVSGLGMIALAFVVVLGVLVEQGWGQGSDASCVRQLAPCLNYLQNQQGRGDPPDGCCDPLKSVIKSNPKCLCSIISNEGAKRAERASIDVSQAQQLPARCGQHVNPISCLKITSPPSARNSVPNSSAANRGVPFPFLFPGVAAAAGLAALLSAAILQIL